MTPPPELSYEDAIRANIKARRVLIDLEQESLAARMRALGYAKWYRQTVGTVEKGGRKVSSSELLGLSLALETSIAALMSPDTSSRTTIVMPSGQVLPANAVSTSAGVGMNEGWVRWDGDTPIWPSEQTIEILAHTRDYSREARESLERAPRLKVTSAEEEQQLKHDVQAVLLHVMRDAGVTDEQLAAATDALGVEPGASDEQVSRILDALGPGGLEALAKSIQAMDMDLAVDLDNPTPVEQQAIAEANQIIEDDKTADSPAQQKGKR